MKKKAVIRTCIVLMSVILPFGKSSAGSRGPGNSGNNPGAPDTVVNVADCRKCIVLAEQSLNRVAIADVESKQIIWEWQPEQSNVKQQHLAWFKATSDAKPVYDGKYILMSASGGGIALIRIADKKTVFYAYAGGNTHSIELLPDGNIVSASSTGNFMTVFRVDTLQPPEEVYSRNFPLRFGHNVVWDDKRQLLWSAADNHLIAFSYNFDCDHPSFTEKEAIDLPGKDAHDLFPVYGKNALWLTNTTNVYQYNLDTRKLEQSVGLQANIKSVSSGDGLLTITTHPKISWWTDEVMDDKGNTVFYQNGLKIYKARWYVKNGFSYPATHVFRQCR